MLVVVGASFLEVVGKGTSNDIVGVLTCVSVAIGDVPVGGTLTLGEVKGIQKCIYYFLAVCRNLDLKRHSETDIEVQSTLHLITI